MIDGLAHGASAHLAQSTLFAGTVALLTPAFRGNRAQVRFWLWLSASLKFLIPFALLSMAGSHIGAWAPPSSVEGIGAAVPTFLAPESPHLSAGAWGEASSSATARAFDRTALYEAMTGLWLLGAMGVALIRLRGWRRIRVLIRGSTSANIAAPVAIRVSTGLMEPGVVGWMRPFLLLPQGIAERLSPSEMSAILAHELCHVRRRDNFLASIHMIVETVFWFHPLVWWIGGRLMEERECACDEDVVSRGNASDVYAEAIVKVCRWSAESPLTCVAGVTGGDIKRRIERIMTTRDVAALSVAKKAALAIAGVAVVMAPVLVGVGDAPVILAQPPAGVAQWQAAAGGHMAFDIASVKPIRAGSRGRAPNFAFDEGDGFRTDSGENPHGRLSAAWVVPVYISFAYKLSLTPDQRQAMLAPLPKWVDTEWFEIDAKAAGNPTKDQMRLMMQSLLAERFHLVVHYETREMPVYALTLIKPGKWGPKLIRHADGPPCDVSGHGDAATDRLDPEAAVFPPRCGTQTSALGKNGRRVEGSRNATMDILAGFLARMTGRPVVDRTGIIGRVDYRLEWTLDDAARAAGRAQLENLIARGVITREASGVDDPPDPTPVMFVDAVREQLGLKLESTKAPVQTLVIDHIERPAEN